MVCISYTQYKMGFGNTRDTPWVIESGADNCIIQKLYYAVGNLDKLYNIVSKWFA